MWQQGKASRVWCRPWKILRVSMASIRTIPCSQQARQWMWSRELFNLKMREVSKFNTTCHLWGEVFPRKSFKIAYQTQIQKKTLEPTQWRPLINHLLSTLKLLCIRMANCWMPTSYMSLLNRLSTSSTSSKTMLESFLWDYKRKERTIFPWTLVETFPICLARMSLVCLWWMP